MRFSPPIGLEYVMAALRPMVDRITIVDMRFEEDADLSRFIDERTSAACISLNWEPGRPRAGVVPEFDVINRLSAGLFTVVGGRWATQNCETVFRECPNVDVVVLGDGDQTIRELAVCRSLGEVRGIAYRADDGGIRRTGTREFGPLSETVFPDRALRRYRYPVASRGIDSGVTMDTVLTSRGCPYHCKFCSCNRDVLGRLRGWEPRSPESVLAELRTIDADVVFIADNNFCVDMDRVGAICDGIVKEGIRKTFALEARVEIARRPDVLRKMARAGMRLLLFGLESATDHGLKALNKGFTVTQAREAFRVFRRYPFVFGAFFIVGNIGEDERDMRAISPYAKQLGIDFICLSYLRADPGSALLDEIGQVPGYHVARDRKNRIYSDRYSFEKLRRIKRAITRDFFFSPHMLRPARRVLTSGVIAPRHAWNMLKGLAAKLLGK